MCVGIDICVPNGWHVCIYKLLNLFYVYIHIHRYMYTFIGGYLYQRNMCSMIAYITQPCFGLISFIFISSVLPSFFFFFFGFCLYDTFYCHKQTNLVDGLTHVPTTSNQSTGSHPYL